MQVKKRTSQWLFPFNRTTKLLIGFTLLVFGAMVWLAFGDTNHFDEAVFAAIPHHAQWFTSLMHYITYLGNTEVLIVANCLLVIFLFMNNEKWVALQVIIVALSSVGLMSLLKRSFHRQRPPAPLIEGITNYSFPSGHAFMSLAFYGMMIWWATIHLKGKIQQRTVIIFFALLILLIGFSRIYLRVHYTTDVIAGFTISSVWLILILVITDRMLKKTRLLKE